MKKIIIAIITLCFLVIGVTGCGSNAPTKESNNIENNNKVVTDISIEEIKWDVDKGIVNGHSYVLFEIENNTKYVIKSIEFNFTEKKGTSKEAEDDFYDDIKISQGFDDEWMNKYVESRRELSQPITMHARYDEEINIGEKVEEVKCYYMGGWTSKNVIHHDILEPEKVTIKYIKDNAEKDITYNFITKKYDI